MGFNNFVNAFLILLGICEFLGMLGGLGFIAYFLMECVLPRLEDDSSEESCMNCDGYEVCKDVMGDAIPVFACAYYKKKKP